MQDPQPPQPTSTDDTVMALYLVQIKLVADLTNFGIIDGKNFASNLKAFREAIPGLSDGTNRIIDSIGIVATRIAEERPAK